MEISKKLKLLREENGLTQDELASKLKLSRSAISNYENGTRTPDIEVLYDLSELYNITLDSFFKDETIYKKKKRDYYKRTLIVVSIIGIILLIICLIIYKLMFPNYKYSYDVSDDELKVNNSNEIAIVKVIDSINNDYVVDIVHNFKGLGFDYIKVKGYNIKIEISSYYLILGNRVSKDENSKNYLSYNYLVIKDGRFIYKLNNYDPNKAYNLQTDESKTLIDYYSYFINNEVNDVVYCNLINRRKDKYHITNKNIFDNPYDKFNLIDDFDYTDLNIDIYLYSYVDVDISFTLDKVSNGKHIVSLYSSEENEDVYNLSELSFRIDNNNRIMVHFRNIPMKEIIIPNSVNIIIRYGYSSIINSSWTNSDLDIRIGFKK